MGKGFFNRMYGRFLSVRRHQRHLLTHPCQHTPPNSLNKSNSKKADSGSNQKRYQQHHQYNCKDGGHMDVIASGRLERGKEKGQKIQGDVKGCCACGQQQQQYKRQIVKRCCANRVKKSGERSAGQEVSNGKFERYTHMMRNVSNPPMVIKPQVIPIKRVESNNSPPIGKDFVTSTVPDAKDNHAMDIVGDGNEKARGAPILNLDHVITRVDTSNNISTTAAVEDKEDAIGSTVDDGDDDSCVSLLSPLSDSASFAASWDAPQYHQSHRKNEVIRYDKDESGGDMLAEDEIKKEKLQVEKTTPLPSMSDVTVSPTQSSGSNSGVSSVSNSENIGSTGNGEGAGSFVEKRRESEAEKMYKNWVLFETVTGRGEDTMRRRTSVMKGDDRSKGSEDVQRRGRRRTRITRKLKRERHGNHSGERKRNRCKGTGGQRSATLTIEEAPDSTLLSGTDHKKVSDPVTRIGTQSAVDDRGMRLVVPGSKRAREEPDPSFWSDDLLSFMGYGNSGVGAQRAGFHRMPKSGPAKPRSLPVRLFAFFSRHRLLSDA